MSASGRMAKKVELKRKWEDSLKEYKEVLLYSRTVLIWKRPIDYGVFLGFVTFLLWMYFSIETTVVSLFSLLIVFWAVVSWLISVTNIRFPWHVLGQDTRYGVQKVGAHQWYANLFSNSNVDHFGDIVGFLVQIRFAVVDTLEELQRFRAANPTRFVLQITASGLLVAYLGSFVSGQFLFVTLIYALLLLPGAVSNGVPERVYVIAEPHIKVLKEKLGILLQGLLQQVEQQLNKAKVPQQPTTDSPSPAENKDGQAKKED